MRQNRNQKRRGAAVAEMAICLPFVILMVVGSIELSSGLFHQMVFRTAVHECATRAADGTTDAVEVQTVAQQILSQHGITDFTITIDEVTRTVNSGTVESNPISHFDIPATGTPTAGLETVPRGTLLKLRLSAPRPPATGLGVISKYLDSQIAAECVFVKEL
jgi:Flp pilus assembly protein TadG